MALIDFSATPEKGGGMFRGKQFDTSNSTWVEETKGGFTGVFFRTTFVGIEGDPIVRDFLYMGAEELRTQYGIVVNDDGELEKVNEDLPAPKIFEKNEVVKLFNSALKSGVPAKVISDLGPSPQKFDGYTFRLTEESKGYKRKDKNGAETKWDATWIIVDADGLIASPDGGKKGKSSSASTSAAASARKTAPAVSDDTEDDDDGDATLDPETQACVATIQNVLSDPKKFIPTFNKKQNDGGVTKSQMSQAAMDKAVPKEFRETPGRVKVSKRLGKADIYEQFHGELWKWDADEGVIHPLD